MKKLILAALVCALLSGCAHTAREMSATLSPTMETGNDNLRCYPLDAADCRFLSVGNDLLVLRPTQDNAELLRCTGRGLRIAQRTQVPSGTEMFTGGEKIGCFDPSAKELTRYTSTLTWEGSWLLPDCAATPVMNREGDRVYYATDQALLELDLETGIHRTLRQQKGLTPALLVEGEGLLICTGEGESRFLRISDGTLAVAAPVVSGGTEGGSQLCVKCGHWDCLYLGKTMLPLPADWSFLTFLPGRNAALVLQNQQTMAIYDLSTGNRLAQMTIPGILEEAWAAEDGRIFFTANGMLYQWEPVWGSIRDNQIKITALYTQEATDEKGLAQCRQRGSYLENQYGVQVLLNTDAVQISPKGVTLEPEYVCAPVLETLSGIEKALSRFPTELVKAAFSKGGRFYICPVRSIRTEAGEEYGIRFWSGRDCYVAVAVSDQIERTMTRLLTELLERQIIMKSDVLDRWDSMNPPGLVYGQTQWDESAFVSPAAAESPAADRAELLWAALEEGNRELFLSARLQNKLRCLSLGLRQLIVPEAGSRLPWEQYLWKQS